MHSASLRIRFLYPIVDTDVCARASTSIPSRRRRVPARRRAAAPAPRQDRDERGVPGTGRALVQPGAAVRRAGHRQRSRRHRAPERRRRRARRSGRSRGRGRARDRRRRVDRRPLDARRASRSIARSTARRPTSPSARSSARRRRTPATTRAGSTSSRYAAGRGKPIVAIGGITLDACCRPSSRRARRRSRSSADLLVGDDIEARRASARSRRPRRRDPDLFKV